MKSRILFFAVLLSVVWGLLILRGFQLQVLPQERLQSLKEKRFQRTVQIDARRGDLVDRQGKELAVSVPRYSLFVDPGIVRDPDEVIQKLSRYLNISRQELSRKVRRKNSRFVWIERKLSREKYVEIKSWGLRGLGFKEEPQRVYPNGQLMGSILGFVGTENRGLEGLELSLESHLSGDQKVMVLQRDARGRPLIESGWMFLKNEDGRDVQLTLDRDLQFFVEQELKRVVEEFSAKAASALVVDVESAEVLALANVPSFDPNKALSAPHALRRNSAVVDSFEPGSTLKSFLVGAALEEGVVKPNTVLDTGGGVLRIGRRRITEADSTHNHESLTVAEVLALSSNVGSAELAFLLGEEKYRSYLSRFGFGRRSGVEFPGEGAGILHGLPWNRHLLATVGFGHGMTATPLQMATAYTTLASGGVHRPLSLVKGVRDPRTGQWKPQRSDRGGERVISVETADTLSMMLTMATGEGGTGRLARIPGFAVAGKTGTAQKVNPNGGGYLEGEYIASFAGYFPVPSPQFVIVVSIDQPEGHYYGSQVAAPVFARVASHLTRREGLSPKWISSSHLVPRQDGSLRDYEKDQRKALSRLLQAESQASAPSLTSLLSLMPDLKGRSLREVVQEFRGTPWKVKVRGDGSSVKRTKPASGQALKEGQSIEIFF